jgi:hypothetical protein
VNPTSIRSWPRRSFQLDVKCLCNQAKHKNSHVAFLLLSFGDTPTGTCFIKKMYAPSSSLLQGKYLPFSPSPLRLCICICLYKVRRWIHFWILLRRSGVRYATYSKGLVYQRANTEPFKNSFLIKTLLDWNQLDDNTVNQSSLESFKTALQHSY